MRALTWICSRLRQQKRQCPSEDQSDTSSGSQSETAKTRACLHTHTQGRQNAVLLNTARIKLVQPNDFRQDGTNSRLTDR